MTGSPRSSALILGSSGMLGTSLVGLLEERGVRYVAFSRAQLDICDTAAVVRALDETKPDTVYNAAAFTDVDGCEDRPEYALDVNGHAVGRLAKAVSERGARLVHISSDYVFDGTARAPYREEDETSPDSAYGVSKELGERLALEFPNVLVVRASWLFGPGGKNFALTIARAAQGPAELRVVDDQYGAPTYTPFLAEALVALAREGQEGIWHYRNREEVSWYGFARAIVDVWGAQREVIPVTSDEFPRKAKRPAYSVLDIERFETRFGRAKTWLQGLEAYHRMIVKRGAGG